MRCAFANHPNPSPAGDDNDDKNQLDNAHTKLVHDQSEYEMIFVEFVVGHSQMDDDVLYPKTMVRAKCAPNLLLDFGWMFEHRFWAYVWN